MKSSVHQLTTALEERFMEYAGLDKGSVVNIEVFPIDEEYTLKYIHWKV